MQHYIQANQEQPYLLFANRALIQQVNLNGSDQKVLRDVPGTNAIAIDFDIRSVQSDRSIYLYTASVEIYHYECLLLRQGYMFWSDVGESKIYRASIDGNSVIELINTGLSVPGENTLCNIT